MRKRVRGAWAGRRLLVGLLLGACLSAGWGSAFAYSGYPGVPASGVDMLEDALDWLGELSGDGLDDPATLVARMEQEAARFFDLEFLAYHGVGPVYLRLNLVERAHLQNRVRDFLFDYLARRFGLFGYTPPGVIPIMPQPSGPVGFVVGADVYHRGGPTLRVLFHIELTSRGWRVRDVTSNGRSVIVDMRAAFAGFPPPPR